MKIRAVSKEGHKLAIPEIGKEIIQFTNDYCTAFIEEIKEIDIIEVEKREAK